MGPGEKEQTASPCCSQTRAGGGGLAGRRRKGPFSIVTVDSSSQRDLYPLFIFEKHVTHFLEKSNQLLEVQLVFLEPLATAGTPWCYNKKLGYLLYSINVFLDFSTQ